MIIYYLDRVNGSTYLQLYVNHNFLFGEQSDSHKVSNFLIGRKELIQK